jgi:aspartyl-tRNA(Asn)/glutamyl-tRNA(Gln) amidotransferase subunit C
MSRIERADVARIAHLSRLELDDTTLDAMTSHMKNMLEFVAVLDRHDAKNASHLSPRLVEESSVTAALRPDSVRPSLSTVEALAMAPEKGKEGFKVPGVLDREEG